MASDIDASAPPTAATARRPRFFRWWSSLSGRVMAGTLVGSFIVFLITAVILIDQVTNSVISDKQRRSVDEASTRVEWMQQRLRNADDQSSTTFEQLSQLVNEVNDQSDDYRIIVQGPLADFYSPGISIESVPDDLIEAVDSQGGYYVAPTELRFVDSDRASEPAVAVGTVLLGPVPGQEYPTFFLFPQSTEASLIRLLWGATATAGVVLIVGLTGVAWLVTRTAMVPVRQASRTASRLAAGSLDERMPVTGTDELADLGASMNHMAGQLQQRIHQLEELSLVQQQFVSDVSHELRTPLTTMRMAAEILDDTKDAFPPMSARSTQLLMSEIGRFQEMLEGLLEISRHDAHVAELTADDTDLVDLLESEVLAVKPLADSMSCTLSLRTDENHRAFVDGQRIRRIVRNLLTNAIEHSDGKSVDVHLYHGEQGATVLVVRDFGVGFDEDQSEKVFQRFWRADPSRARTVGGSGLGLAIAREDAQLHGGTLTARGRPGLGATFTLMIPSPEIVHESSTSTLGSASSTDSPPDTPHEMEVA